MKRWQEAFENGDQNFFNFFSEDMTIFALSTPTRIDGLETYQHGFGPVFALTSRKSQILSPEVRLLGPDSAVMTFHNRILIHGVSTNIRGTVIFARDSSGALKCVHMHNSPLAAPPVQPPAPQTLDDVTLLEERVASAVAMVGTPK
jgi:ketosteroid isomerase-like protein